MPGTPVCPFGNVPGSGSALLHGLRLPAGVAKGTTAVAAKAAAAGGAAAGGKGLCLGLGIGLGLWGPLLLATATAAGAVYVWQHFLDNRAPSEEEAELTDALTSRQHGLPLAGVPQ